ncbi:MAG TPA: aldehyde dehydrogenase family protein [Flavobacteriales bacterium]
MSASIAESLNGHRRFFEEGRTRSYTERRKALKALGDALMANEAQVLEALHRDMRKPVFEAYLSEIGLLRQDLHHALDHLAEWMRPQRVSTPLALQPASSRVQRDPLGVVLIIAPWNYPLLLLLSPLVAAIAAGNCAVLKPSEDAPHTAAVVERIIATADLQPWVSVVQGDGRTVVPELIAAFRFDHIFFTGSPRVGAIVATLAAPQLIPVTLELGGKSPAIVDERVDLECAARRIAWGKFFNAGQTCISPDHALVHAAVMPAFLDAITRHTRRSFGEDPQRSPHFARMVNDRRFEAVKGYLGQGRVHLGGEHDAADRYIAPTVLTDVPADAAVMREEIFGPVLPVIPWREPEEVFAQVARNPFPLSLYVFSRNGKRIRLFTERIAFGGGCVNNTLAHFGNPELPLGGIGTSGMGRYHGRYGFEVFSHAKGIVHSSTLFDPGVQYPPYTSWKQRILRRALR